MYVCNLDAFCGSYIFVSYNTLPCLQFVESIYASNQVHFLIPQVPGILLIVMITRCLETQILPFLVWKISI